MVGNTVCTTDSSAAIGRAIVWRLSAAIARPSSTVTAVVGASSPRRSSTCNTSVVVPDREIATTWS